MDEFGLTHWIVFTLLPLIITIYSILSKISKEKTDQATRISKVEENINAHDEALKMINTKLEKQNEEFKTLHKLEEKSNMILRIMGNIEKDLKQRRN